MKESFFDYWSGDQQEEFRTIKANSEGIVNWNSEGKALFFDEKPILNHYIGYSVMSPNFFDMLNNVLAN